MPYNNKRAPFALLHNADLSGCMYHRIVRPTEILGRLGLLYGRVEMQFLPQDILRQMNPDIVVFQRQEGGGQADKMREYREVLPNAHFVYEIDDCLSAVPKESFHFGSIPTDIDERTAAAALVCDVITVTTHDLAKHMRVITGDKVPVRVIANMLGLDDLETAKQARQQARTYHKRPRIGWGGGISHHGDLSLIHEAIEATADRYDWVFLGMKPEVGVPVEFHDGVGPREYLAKLAKLNLDLMVAPLQDNKFNRCKSNLRLVEGGFCGYPVIAGPVRPYADGSPPVVAYAEDTESWIANIDAFCTLGIEQREALGEKMRAWAVKYHCMDNHAEKRVEAWLPNSQRAFRPRKNEMATGLTVVCAKPVPELSQYGKVVTSFDDVPAGHDVLYVRHGALFTPDIVSRMQAHAKNPIVASVSALHNDGGPCGFPNPRGFTPMDVRAREVDEICRDAFAELSVDLPFASSTLVLLPRRILSDIGTPEADHPLGAEAALLEWSMLASMRGYRHRPAANVFVPSLYAVPPLDMQVAANRAMLRWPVPQVQPDQLAETRSSLEVAMHRRLYRFPLPVQGSGYAQWSSLFDEPGENDLRQLAVAHGEIKWLPAAYDGTKIFQELLDESKDVDFVVFVRPGAFLAPHAAWMFSKALAEDGVIIAYADHDHIENGERKEHAFKTNFDFEQFLGNDYITPVFAVRRDSLVRLTQVAYVQDQKLNETNLYRMVLRHAIGCQNMDTRSMFSHVDRVLAHLPMPPTSPMTAKKAKIANAMLDEEYPDWGMKVKQHPYFQQYAEISYDPPSDFPKVSIIIPTLDKIEMLEPCIGSLLKLTDYKNYEIIICENGSKTEKMLDYLAKIVEQDERIRVIGFHEPFNWSKLNNFAVKHATGEFFLFLNDDTRPLEAHWLSQMVGCARRPNVGTVGARLLYPNALIQHVGVVCSHGLSGHLHKGLPQGHPGYGGLALISHEVTANTGACLLVSRTKFKEVGGFVEELSHNFNDVAFGLEMMKRGYVNIMCGRANLHHLEGVTRPSTLTEDGSRQLQEEGKILARLYPTPDPYWNVNLMYSHSADGTMVSGLNCDQVVWPARAWPWRASDTDEPESVLVVGDDGKASVMEIRDGRSVYQLFIDGFRAIFQQPPLQNVQPMDIRSPEQGRALIDGLGIKRAIVRSIVGMPIEVLSFLTNLGLEIEYRPWTGELACPQTNFKRAGETCADGWQTGACQACVNTNNSPFGRISLAGWRDSWENFLATGPKVDFRDCEDKTKNQLIQYITMTD